MGELIAQAGLDDVDPRLIEEALRRGCEAQVNRGVDPMTILKRILAEARRGTRDMYGLVSAANRLAAATSG